VIKNILATVDGSAYSNAVVEQSLYLAKRYNAFLRFLTILDVRISEWAVSIGADGFMPTIPISTYQKETQKLLEEKAGEVLKKCAQRAEHEQVKFSTVKVAGSPVEVICDQARMADLIIMGRRGEYARWSRGLMGATLDGTVREAHKPILVLPQEHRDIKKLLLAYDCNPQANHALQFAADLADRLESSVVVLAVNDDQALAGRAIQEALEYLRPYDLDVDSQISGGGAGEAILSACEQLGTDLAVMGAHGHTRLREALLGSTTEEVLRKIEIPLLLAR